MLSTETRDRIRKRAIEILTANDRGSYTVPTHGLYPFQWNWDSSLTAIGFSNINEARAWVELETLLAHQWPNGMVPHIIFHEANEGYFPGPSVWKTNRPTPTSGITQPAVAGFALQKLWTRSAQDHDAAARVRSLLLAIDRWHQWFYDYRDPHDTGLVAVLHPWETGRDNSVDWDEAFERVPTEGVKPYKRRDLDHADSSMRPTMAQYDRYIWLVEQFHRTGWSSRDLHDTSRFKIVDPGFNAILIRSCEALEAIATELNEPAVAARNRACASRGVAALETLWSDAHGQYVCFDRVSSQLIDSASIGGLLPVFAIQNKGRTAQLVERLETLSGLAPYQVASHDPDADKFDSRRYWRGPVWLIVNYMIAQGLRRNGENQMADRIDQSSLELVASHGMAEYFDPLDGTACGGKDFTWTAAMVLELLRE